MNRDSWNEYFINITNIVATRSTCLRRLCGVIIVKDKRILSSGYNGAPENLEHCDTYGCVREKFNIPSGQRDEVCRGVHAEQNAIIQAGKFGISIEGSVMYSTTYPCVICTKMIINSGITKVYYQQNYENKLAKELFKEAKITTERI